MGLAVLVGVGAVVAGLALSTPGWYRAAREVGDAAALDAAANRFEDRLVELGNFVAGEMAAEARAARRGGEVAGGGGGGRWVWVVSGEELNAFVRRWAVLHGGEGGGQLARVLAGDAEPVVTVRGGRVWLAARVEGWAVVTMAWRPGVEGGEFRMALEGCWVGRLRVPVGLVRGLLVRGAGSVGESVVRWRADARVDGRGRGNMPMALASGGQVLMAALEGSASPDVVFVPVDERSSAAVRVLGVSGEGEVLEVTLGMVPAGERAAAGARVRGR